MKNCYSSCFSQEWDVARGINVNGSVLTCEGETKVDPDKWRVFGARYTRPLCPECPHFEVKYLFYELVSKCLERITRTKDQMFVSYDRGIKKMRKLLSQTDWLA